MPMIRIPAAQVTAGHLPQICARHGRQATSTKNAKFISKPPAWAAVLILLGALPYLIVVMALRKTTKAPTWPWCDECAARRKKMLGIGLGVVGASLLLIVVGIAMANDTSGLLAFVGFIGLLVGIIVAAQGGAQAVAGAVTSRDGQFVEIAKGSDQFAMALQQGAIRV